MCAIGKKGAALHINGPRDRIGEKSVVGITQRRETLRFKIKHKPCPERSEKRIEIPRNHGQLFFDSRIQIGAAKRPRRLHRAVLVEQDAYFFPVLAASDVHTRKGHRFIQIKYPLPRKQSRFIHSCLHPFDQSKTH